jgi:DNA-binding MarR family transcriptional regulator
MKNNHEGGIADESRLKLVLAVHRATHRIGLYLEAAIPPLETSQGEAHLLAHLYEVKEASVGDLHRAFAHKRSSLTSYLDRLEAKKLITRSTHPEDRRSFWVALTPKGRALATRVHRHLRRLEERAFSALPEAQVRAATAALAGLATAGEATGEKR